MLSALPRAAMITSICALNHTLRLLLPNWWIISGISPNFWGIMPLSAACRATLSTVISPSSTPSASRQLTSLTLSRRCGIRCQIPLSTAILPGRRNNAGTGLRDVRGRPRPAHAECIIWPHSRAASAEPCPHTRPEPHYGGGRTRQSARYCLRPNGPRHFSGQRLS